MDEFLTEHEVSARLRIKPATLRDQRYRGAGIPYVKIGRAVRYRLSDVEAYLQRNTHDTATGERDAGATTVRLVGSKQ